MPGITATPSTWYCAALELRSQRIRRQQGVAYSRVMATSMKELPEKSARTPADDRFADIHNGNCDDARLYRNALS